MRTISFVLAFAVVLAGISGAGSAPETLPGVGTFAFQGTTDTPVALPNIVASR